MADDPGANLGEVTTRKKGRFGTYVIIGVISLVVILGVTLFMPGEDENGGNANGVSPSPAVPVTIAELQAQIITTNERIATLEGTVAGIAGPTVTQEDIASLQTTIDSLTADVANWTEALEALETNTTATTSLNISSGLTYNLTKDSDGDIRIHVLSAEDVTLMAEVTLFYDDPIILSNATLADSTTYSLEDITIENVRIDDVLEGIITKDVIFSLGSITIENAYTINDAYVEFYNDVGRDRDYAPTLVPVALCESSGGCILVAWEYSVVTFHVGPFDVEANEVWNDYIDESYLLSYDTIGIKLFPTKEETGSSDGDNGL